MNANDELRAKHIGCEWLGQIVCYECSGYTSYPCAVIALLDENAALVAALESLTERVPAMGGPKGMFNILHGGTEHREFGSCLICGLLDAVKRGAK